MNRLLIPATIFSLCLWATGCKNDNKDTEPSGHHKMSDQNMTGAVANIEPTKGNTARGTVMFQQMGEKVRVIADISGLAPNSKHGFHVHEGTECGDDGMLAKGHYNPEQHQHGLPSASSAMRHAGDFGNIQADGSGKAHLDITVDNISISGQKNPIVGHALIVHEKEDDGSQPTGNAGARIGCGIIKAGRGVAAAGRDYIIGRYDLITVSVVDPNSQELARAARVSESGVLSVPGLPEGVRADGLTERQLERDIATAFQQAKIHQDAKVFVNIVEASVMK